MVAFFEKVLLLFLIDEISENYFSSFLFIIYENINLKNN